MNLRERNENMRNFFNDKIATYDDTHAKFMKTKSQITDALPGDIEKVLDLGAGTGLELIPLFQRFPNARVTAIDITENMIEKLREREFAKNVKTIIGDFFEVDFGHDYDAVISTSALHHFLVEDKIKLYKKVYDCLREGGIFINSDKVASSVSEEKQWLDDYYKYKDVRPHNDTPLAVEKEYSSLIEAGFSDVEIKRADAENYCLIKAIK